MKILRQKLFTFQDKKAFLEFYKATGGLKHLPKGKKGMNARDVYRINDIARKIDYGDLEGINYDEARQVLERMGLPESGKGIKHLIQKYRNIYDSEFQKRFQRIHNREVNQIKNKYDTKQEKVGELNWHYGINYSPRNIDRLEAMSRKLEDQKNTELAPFVKRRAPKSASKVYNSSLSGYEEAGQRLDNIDPMKDKDFIPGSEPMNSMNSVFKKLSRVTPKTQIESGNRNSYNTYDDIITVKPGAHPYVLGHEVGHAISSKKGLSTGLEFSGDIRKLAEENYASSQANAIHNLAVKKGEITPTYAERGEGYLNDAFQTYLNAGVRDINYDMYNKFPIYKKSRK